MIFGYLIVRTLLPLVRTISHLPPAASAAFATGLDAAHRPFHLVNYLGSCGGAIVFNDHRMAAKAERVVAALHRQLDAGTDDDLARGMHFPPCVGKVDQAGTPTLQTLRRLIPPATHSGPLPNNRRGIAPLQQS